ncbi:MAG: hypothetical protein GEU91_08620 [Rhizobiales bacterium]|nr:hypothetical protein [Hyphomicrobiales bacterium]
MPIRMPKNTRLATEKPVVKNPLAVNYRPPKSIPYRVTDNDTKGGWKEVALRNNVDVQKLIWFNFRTNNSDEVNWYLRRNTGCNLATDNRLNWMFSSSADPGIIYLPIDKIDMDPHVIESRGTIFSPFAQEFQGPHNPVDILNKAFDAMQLIEIGLAIVGSGLPLGPFALMVLMTAQQFVLVGAPHEAALNELRKKQILEGLTRGIVLAADGRSPKWIQDHGFVMPHPLNNVKYPQYGKQLQGIYNTSLVAGIAHGQQFNTVGSKALFMGLRAKMTDYARSEYSGNPDNWSDRKWEEYYRLCAAILQPTIKLK